jgi:transcriptional regulator NrdR family protein
MPPKGIYIIKSDGVRELFDREKLLRSLRKIGTDKTTADMIVAKVEGDITEGNTTREIYKKAFTLKSFYLTKKTPASCGS